MRIAVRDLQQLQQHAIAAAAIARLLHDVGGRHGLQVALPPGAMLLGDDHADVAWQCNAARAANGVLEQGRATQQRAVLFWHRSAAGIAGQIA